MQEILRLRQNDDVAKGSFWIGPNYIRTTLHQP